MPRRSTPVEWAPWEPDRARISSAGRVAKGVLASAGKYIPLEDLSTFGQGQLQDQCIGARGFYDRSGGVRIYLGDASGLYQIFQGSPRNISRDGGYGIDQTTGWSFTQFGNIILASGRGAPLQYIEVGGTGDFQDVEGAPPSDAVFTVREHALVGYNNELRWSAFNDPLFWDPAQIERQAGFAFLPQEGGRIVAGIGGENGTIFQERMISRLTYVGGPTVWQRDTVENNRGAIGRRAIAAYGRMVMYCSEDGLFAFDGLQSAPIGDNKVNKYFVSRLNYSARHRVSCAFDTGRKCWMVTFPAGGSETPNEQLIYSLTDQRWTHDEIDMQILFDMPIEGVSVDDANKFQQLFATTNADLITESVDSPAFADSRRQWGVVTTSNAVATFTGSPRRAVIETGEFEALPGRQLYVSEIWPQIDSEPADIQIKLTSRRSKQVDIGLEESSTMTDEGYCPVRSEGRYMAVEMTVPAATSWSESTGLQWVGKPAGDR